MLSFRKKYSLGISLISNKIIADNKTNLFVTDSPLSRLVSQHYEDGVCTPSGTNRPNPREISNALMTGPSGLPSIDNKTAFFVFFSNSKLSNLFHQMLLDKRM